jgi:hypothetical protein
MCLIKSGDPQVVIKKRDKEQPRKLFEVCGVTKFEANAKIPQMELTKTRLSSPKLT